jgi:hypothetical protein
MYQQNADPYRMPGGLEYSVDGSTTPTSRRSFQSASSRDMFYSMSSPSIDGSLPLHSPDNLNSSELVQTLKHTISNLEEELQSNKNISPHEVKDV